MASKMFTVPFLVAAGVSSLVAPVAANVAPATAAPVSPAALPVSAKPAKTAYLAAVALYNVRVRAEAAAKVKYLAALKTPSTLDNAPALKAYNAARMATVAAKVAVGVKLAAWKLAKTRVAGVFLGAPSATNPYGPTQVSFTAKAGKIVSITYPVYPKENSDSKIINEWALPQLVTRAIAAQSAKIASVSGASLTSPDFKASLTSALTAAGLV